MTIPTPASTGVKRTVMFVPTANPTKDGARQIDLADIPLDVREEIEEAYVAMKANPNGRFRAEFETKADLLTYLAQANAYAAQRPDGPIRIRRSPSKGLAENVMDFRVTDVQTEEEKRTAEIRKAAAAAGGTPVAADAGTAASVKPTAPRKGKAA